jgi:hypothetical protein
VFLCGGRNILEYSDVTVTEQLLDLGGCLVRSFDLI